MHGVCVNVLQLRCLFSISRTHHQLSDGGGSISFKELQRCLHLSAGAAGKAAKAAEAKKLKEYKEMMGR